MSIPHRLHSTLQVNAKKDLKDIGDFYSSEWIQTTFSGTRGLENDIFTVTDEDVMK